MPVAFLALLLAAPAAASPQAGPKLGEWVKAGDEDLVPNAGVDLYLKQKPQPGIYRHIAVNWRDRPSRAGSFPAQAFAARQEGQVFLSLTVAADGRPTACRVTRPSGIAVLDEHSCGDALAQTVFHPGLDDKGKRFGGTVEGRMSYNLHPVALPMLIEDAGWNWPSRKAEPQQPITLETLGIPGTVKARPGTDTIRVMLATDPGGAVTACLLTFPTFDDALDKGVCDRLRNQPFRPALDRKQNPVASIYEVVLPLPR